MMKQDAEQQTTIRVSKNLVKELNKIKGGLMKVDGEPASHEDAIWFLLKKCKGSSP